MDVPLYALEGLGNLGAFGSLETLRLAIKAKIIKEMSSRLKQEGITAGGTNVPMRNISGINGLGAMGTGSGAGVSPVAQKTAELMSKKSQSAKAKLRDVSNQLLVVRKRRLKAQVEEMVARQRRDKEMLLKAKTEYQVSMVQEKALVAAQQYLAMQVAAPKITRQEILRAAMPDIEKTAQQLAEAVKANVPRGTKGPMPVVETPFDIPLLKSQSPLNVLLRPEGGLNYGPRPPQVDLDVVNGDDDMGQFDVIDTREMDIQGLGSFWATTPPFNEHAFPRISRQSQWSRQFDSPETSDMFGGLGDGDASESAGSDDWSKPNDTFPGYPSQRWDFDQNVLAQRAPTKFNVDRLIRGGTKAAMRTIDQTGSVQAMNDNLAQFGIVPKPAGQPFTTAGNVAYIQIVRGLANNKIISTINGKPADVKLKPKRFRAVVSSAYRKERQLRNKRRKYLRWLGR